MAMWIHSRKRIKWIVCMCSLFIANTNEKWAHPFPLSFLPPCSVSLALHNCLLVFLQRSIWKELQPPPDHKKGKCLPLRTGRRRCQQGPWWVSIRHCSWTESNKYYQNAWYVISAVSVISIKIMKKQKMLFDDGLKLCGIMGAAVFIVKG